MSTGDFSIIGSALYLDPMENFIFWLCWVIIVVVTCIVFLNFIIAEAGHSYEIVNEFIDSFIARDKASLIAESEDMLPKCLKSKKLFPKYIIIREVDNWRNKMKFNSKRI